MKHPGNCLQSSSLNLKKIFSNLLLGLGIVAFGPISGQNTLHEIKGARNKALGDLGAAQEGLDGYIYNPAALGNIRNSVLLLNAENRFQGTGIRGYSICASLPVGENSCLGGMIEQYGVPEYLRRQYRLGFGLALNKRFTIGTAFGMKTYTITAYSSALSLKVDLGMTYLVANQITLGWCSLLPFFNSDYIIPETPVHIFAIKYKTSEMIDLHVQIEKENQLNWAIKYALEYWVVPHFGLRLGLAPGNSVLHAGFGFKVNQQMDIDGAFSIHSALGITPAISLRYQLKSLQVPGEKL